MQRQSLKNNIKNSISQSPDYVFMPRDFFYLSDRDQVGRAFRQLYKEKFLLKVGYGVYVKTKKSKYTGKIIPSIDLRAIANETLNKLGVLILPTAAECAYNNKSSTQIPNGFVIGVNKRISRKLSLGDVSIKYEKIRT